MVMDKIPNLSALRAGKPGYETRYAIDTEHPLHNDPLEDPREFGFEDASSYYSKPSKLNGETLPGVPDAPLLRLDIVRRLLRADAYLRTDSDVRDALGSPAHIRIDDGLRPLQVQKYAFEVAWPKAIKSKNPGMSDEDIREIIPNYCAKPNEKLTPTPHLTGGAVDVALVNLATGKSFDRGHKAGAVEGTAYPDFHEGYHLVPGQSDIEYFEAQTEVTPDDSVVVLGRRILYHAMTSVAGLDVNPQEIWHYGKGDPLSEYVSGSHHPYYGIAELPEWYIAALSELHP